MKSETGVEHLTESEIDDRTRYAAALTVVRYAGTRPQMREALDMLGLLDVHPAEPAVPYPAEPAAS